MSKNYIDRDKLVEKIKSIERPVGGHEMFYLLMDAPVVDISSPLGNWIETGNHVSTSYGALDIYKCSNCKKLITIDDYDNYCPCCGSKMC